MDVLLQDLKFSIRSLLKDRAFTATAGITLILCIAANAAIFGVVESVVLRPLPFPEPERLVTMWNAYPGAGVGRGSNGAPDYVDRRALTDVFEELAALQVTGLAVEVEGNGRRVDAMRVTPGFFPLLGATPTAGRLFTEAEGELGNHRVVVLAEEFATETFGAPAAAVGRTLEVNGETVEVVGVMPAGWVFLDPEVRIWAALAFTEDQLQSFHSNSYGMVARLAPGVSLDQAQARIDALNASNNERMGELKAMLEAAGFHTPLTGLQEDLVRDVRGTLYLLWGGAAFVLLIGCLNVANLALVRSTARARELATRFALGARRGRIVRQLLTETTLLTVVAAGGGLLLGSAAIRSVRTILADQVPRAETIGLAGPAVGFTFLLALFVGVFITLVPLAGLGRQDLSAVFREEGRTGTSGRGVRLARKGMVVAQIAFALLLLVGAALLLASFRQLLGIDPGFAPEGVLSARVSLPEVRYGEAEREHAVVAEIVEGLSALPGVTAAAATNQVPLGGGASDSVIFAEGHVLEPGESPISPLQYLVTPEYFRTMGIPVIQGRVFDDADSGYDDRVIVIDQRLARRYFPEGDAVGKRMWQPTSLDDLSDPANAIFFRIVGVVGSVTHRGLADQGAEVGAYYFPVEKVPFSWGAFHFLVRTEGDPRSLIGALRGAVAEADPLLPVYDVRTMPERVRESLADRRSPLVLSLTFGAVALFLAAVGIYGVLAHLVSLRTRELGIRMALGCEAPGIFRLVFGEALVILVLGVTLGLAGAFGVGQALRSQLYGVSALDPVVLTAVTGLLSLVALVACLVPARRATRIDPVHALTDS